MPSKKHSQISPATTPPSLSDQIVGVKAAATDTLWSLSQIASIVGGSGGGGGGINIGTTPISPSTPNTLLYDGAGVVREATVGSGLILSGGVLSATGGGGGGGSGTIATPTNIAALQAVDTTVFSVAVLTQAGRSGTFLWDPANHTTDVASDPGQGVFVSKAGDNGSLGAWVRQFSGSQNLAWWGVATSGLVVDTSNSGITPTLSSTPVFVTTGLTTFAVGQNVLVEDWFYPMTNWLLGTVTGYNSSTRALNLSVSSAPGSIGPTPRTAVPVTITPVIGAANTFFGAHSITADNQPVILGTTGQLPAPFVSGVVYFTVNTVVGVSFQLAQAPFFSPIIITGTTQGGTHTISTKWNISFGSAAPNDNSVALANFGVYGRQYVARTGEIAIVAPPGRIRFNDDLCYKWNCNLGTLSFNGAGTSWINMQTTQGFGFSLWWDGMRYQGPVPPNGPANMLLTANTVVGSQSFQVATADAARLAVGQPVCLMSLDTQGNGWPPNPQQFEFVTPVSFGAPSGGNVVVTIKEIIQYNHLTDYPDNNFAAGEAPLLVGRARAWIMNTGPWTVGNGTSVGSYSVPILYWNINYEFIGPMQWEIPAWALSSQPIQALTGETVTTRNVTSTGFAESITRNVNHYGYVALTAGETDKLNVSIVHHATKSNFFISLQSPNENIEYIDGCQLLGGIASGPTKRFIIKDSAVNVAAIGRVGGSYGVGVQSVWKNCKIFGNSTANVSLQSVLDGTTEYTIDGSHISYGTAGFGASAGPGIFCISIAWLASTFPFNGFVTWVPGTFIAFQAGSGGGIFPGDPGVFRILRAWDDGSFIYFVTDGPATVPSYCTSNKIWLFQQFETRFEDCYGSDMVRDFSDATRAGYQYYEYKRYVFAGTSGDTSGLFLDSAGTVTSITVNVIKPGSNTSASLTIHWGTYNMSSNYAPDSSGGLSIKVNIGAQARKIVLTTTSITPAPLAGDLFQLNGAALPGGFLPTDRVVGTLDYGTAFWSASRQTAPTVEVIITYDCGMVRKLLPIQFNPAGTALIGVTGAIP